VYEATHELTEDADADINALWLYVAQNNSPNTATNHRDPSRCSRPHTGSRRSPVGNLARTTLTKA
jgi:hypothetical protein